jgi:hypothetical protein
MSDDKASFGLIDKSNVGADITSTEHRPAVEPDDRSLPSQIPTPLGLHQVFHLLVMRSPGRVPSVCSVLQETS